MRMYIRTDERKTNCTLLLVICGVLCFFFVGCAVPRQTDYSSKIVEDYLASKMIYGCKVKDYDYKRLLDYKQECIHMDFSYITEMVDEVICTYYQISDSNKKIVESGDMICISYRLLDADDTLLVENKNVKIYVSEKGLLKNTKDYLAGKTIGSIIRRENKSDPDDLLFEDNAQTIEIVIENIIEYKPYKETGEWLIANDFSDFSSFYSYLLEKKIDEFQFEQKNRNETEFLLYAAECGDYIIDKESVVQYAVTIAKEYENIALSFNMDLDGFCRDILGINSEKDFYIKCTKDAYTEIKGWLAIGAIAKRFEVELNDDDVEQFCMLNHIDKQDSVLMSAAKLECLKNKVLQIAAEGFCPLS